MSCPCLFSGLYYRLAERHDVNLLVTEFKEWQQRLIHHARREGVAVRAIWSTLHILPGVASASLWFWASHCFHLQWAWFSECDAPRGVSMVTTWLQEVTLPSLEIDGHIWNLASCVHLFSSQRGKEEEPSCKHSRWMLRSHAEMSWTRTSINSTALLCWSNYLPKKPSGSSAWTSTWPPDYVCRLLSPTHV